MSPERGVKQFTIKHFGTYEGLQLDIDAKQIIGAATIMKIPALLTNPSFRACKTYCRAASVTALQ